MVASDVVNGHASLDAETQVGNLRHSLEAAVLGTEVYVSCPVVREILRVRAAGACRIGRGVVLAGPHRDVERVSTDDLVHVLRRQLARVDQGINAVDGQLGATEAHEFLRGDELPGRQGGHKSFQHHLVVLSLSIQRLDRSEVWYRSGLQKVGLAALSVD